ncbi:MAG: glycoside hydrolase family 9 protein [Fibrobacter sp.]|nr:glycoside hydrolase family 9 protein [Fibrobacter sp.]
MKCFYKIIVLTLALFAVDTFAQLPNLDRTDKTHERRYLDSINVYNRRPIRVNQSGFRPQDYKYAYVADPSDTKFRVIDANSGAEAWSGSLQPIMRRILDTATQTTHEAQITKPNIYVNGLFMAGQENQIYEFGKRDDNTSATEKLYRADFSGLSPATPGEYFVVVGKDTSATFLIHPSIFNSILENSLKFFGIQRCGNTKSHFHAACHLKDGSKVGHDLTGGWHDCGDHFKVSETLGYATYVLSMVYLTYQDKAEDRYGNSYADTVFTDGIPDILYEAKIGADFLLKLYHASKADGLIAKGDMYHSVGVSQADHEYWDLPERQDAQTPENGGPDRVVLTGAGSNVVGMFVAAMANVAVGYRVYDAEYADSLIEAAKDIYKNVLMPSFDNYAFGGTPGRKTDFPGFYTGGGPLYDDGAAAAFALWYATKDTTYQYDLYKNKNIFENETNYHYNLDYFRAGFLGNPSGFTPGGWATDYQNIHSLVLFAFQRLILNSEATAEAYGLTPIERDSLTMRTLATFRKVLDNSTNQGDSLVLTNPGIESKPLPEDSTQQTPHEGPTKLHVISPYNLVWTSFDWGVMRYNMGTANAIFLMYELTGDERYLKVALDNMYFILGANPWDVSLLIGAGDKNLNHPHNRSANPDGYNAGGMPYEYRAPLGALMGGRDPNKTLSEDGSEWTCTETCIDFTAQFLFPAQSLAQSLPLDVDGPLFSNIAGTPITDTSAIVSWDANEVALVTVFYNTTPDAAGAKSVQQTKASKGGSVTLEGLTPGQTYYFFLEGMDTKRNISTDDNHGLWYQFTMTNATTNISGVTICQVDHRSAKIYWWTSDRMNGIVNFGKSRGIYSDKTVSSDGAVLFHEVTLANLDPGTTYYFSVSSGMTTDDNGGRSYEFTTDAYSSYADLDISIKPSSYQSDAQCSNWKDCRQFIVNISNNDTIPFEDFEIRFYLNSPNLAAICNIAQKFGGGGVVVPGNSSVSFGTAEPDGVGGYYLPIKVNGQLEVSGRIVFQILFHDYNPSVKTTNFGELEGSWSLRPHTDESDPELFNGVDLTKGPYYTGSETSFTETVNGVKEPAFVRDPYIAVYYHGRHIYGYTPDYSPENGPQIKRDVALTFSSPFISPRYSVEKIEPQTTYQGSATVTPSGVIDDIEMNGTSQDFTHNPSTRYDIAFFSKDTTLAYGNNYMEWVAWHNHGANKKAENKYDCACAVVRSNVEIDTITKPAEPRYLAFTDNEYTAYTDKRTEVHVKLYDTTFALIDTVTLTLNLSTESGNVSFWNTATAVIPVTTITLINGEATFFVSSNEAINTKLIASTASNKDYTYSPATAKLVISDLPPWPIIDMAKMVDTDCDLIPDAISITLSNEYQDGQSFNSIEFTYEDETYTSNSLISQSGKTLLVKADVQNWGINTNPSGSITLLSNINGQVQKHSDFYQDGIGPALFSVSVLERLNSATSDKVYLEFSEPISSPGSEWPLQLYASNQTTLVDDPIVKFTKIYNDPLNIWEFEIGFDASGKSIVTEGMFANLLARSNIVDKNGNGISATCAQPKLPVTLKILPVPLTYASISDIDQDGHAEHIDMTFERSIDSRHTPDSISVIFGTTEPETLWVKKSDIAVNGMGASVNLKTPFSLGITSGTFEGFSGGKAVSNAGFVMQHLGTGASYETSSVLAEDLVGPVFVSASLTLSSSGEWTLVNIQASEPLHQKIGDYVYYRQKQGERDTAIYANSLLSFSLYADNMQMMSTYRTDSDLAPNDGDFVRLEPQTMSAFTDINGNMPSLNNPWTPILSNEGAKTKFKFGLQNEIAISSKEEVSLVQSNETIRIYVQDPGKSTINLIENGVVTQQGIDTSSINGAIWRLELTVPRGTSVGKVAAWDSMKVTYKMPIYSNLGNYVNRLNTSFMVNPNQYLSSANKVVFYVEWANLLGSGIVAENKKTVATGAYIYKAEVETKFFTNPNTDPELASKFSSKSSYDKTGTFGIKRKSTGAQVQ